MKSAVCSDVSDANRSFGCVILNHEVIFYARSQNREKRLPHSSSLSVRPHGTT